MQDRGGGGVDYQKALRGVRRLLEAHVQAGSAIPSFVVLVGGTALAAHEVRLESGDIDLYAPKIDFDVVQSVEDNLRAEMGGQFKIDVTLAENIWGHLMLRDIAEARTVRCERIGDHVVDVRVLSLEDLYILKLEAGRPKDKDDLDLIAARVTPESLSARFAQVLPWVSDRHRLVGMADRFVSDLGRRFGVDEVALVDSLDLPRYAKDALKRPGRMPVPTMSQPSRIHDLTQEVNAAILEDGRVLLLCARLINGRTPWGEWPPGAASALLGAVCSAVTPTDARRATDLHWHLFRGALPAVPPTMAEPSREADRLRADLPSLVRLGGGKHLVPSLRRAIADPAGPVPCPQPAATPG